jgi:hypothetical protein
LGDPRILHPTHRERQERDGWGTHDEAVAKMGTQILDQEAMVDSNPLCCLNCHRF